MLVSLCKIGEMLVASIKIILKTKVLARLNSLPQTSVESHEMQIFVCDSRHVPNSHVLRVGRTQMSCVYADVMAIVDASNCHRAKARS